MIDYLQRMFPYEAWANAQVIETLMNDDQSSLDLMMHIQAAKHLWLCQITGVKRELAVFPKGNHELIKEYNERNILEFSDWLSKQTEKSLDETVSYVNAKRERFTTKISDIMLQLMNHSTYHRAQIAKNISNLGRKPNPSDYIVYNRLFGTHKIQ